MDNMDSSSFFHHGAAEDTEIHGAAGAQPRNLTADTQRTLRFRPRGAHASSVLCVSGARHARMPALPGEILQAFND
ncbi:MAG: hypothetical protein DMG08_04180 [Acidobacteria bacterium]|nr:MAG: hypothetical protein DMG08_04180 [Acidobacteriota bacterium]PYV37668.1 MAG: hypothetical protein DMG09_14165 [Acidobacteriota bacterium]